MSGSSYLAPLSSVLLMMMTLAAPGAKAYPNGAPVQRCQDMTPNHRDNTQQPNEASPFMLTTSKANYSAGEIITVTIRSTPPTMFRGLLLQARDSSSMIVGTFINPSSGVKPLACNGIDNTAVTHTSRADKPEVSVSWKAPMAGVGDVTFRATVVQNFATFYVGLSSAPITYMAMDNNMNNNNMNNNNDNNNMNNNNDNNMNNHMGDMTKGDMGGMNKDDMMRGGGDSTGVSVTSSVVVLSVTLLLSRLL